MKTKEEFQREGTKAIAENGNCLIAAATGVGKSKIVIDYLKFFCNSTSKFLLVVPTEKLRDEDWKAEFIKWDAEYIWYSRVTKICYASLLEHPIKNYDVVILDEIQNITENNSKYFDNSFIKKIIGLSATLPKEIEKDLIIRGKLQMKVVFDVPIDVAVANKLISPFEITVIEIELDNTIKSIKGGSKEKSFMQTEFSAYWYLSEEIEKQKELNPAKAKFLILKRMRLIYSSPQKTLIAKNIISQIPEKEKVLIFAGSIKQAVELYPYTYHSKSKKKDKDKDLLAFDKGEITRLSCVASLNEGVNINSVDTAVITQVTSKDRHLIQRIGRIVRYRENHIGQIYIIIIKNTVDEKWLYNALSGISNIVLKFTNYKDLKI